MTPCASTPAATPAGPDFSLVKAVSFDLDDTLWLCAPVIEGANRAMFEHMFVNFPAVHSHLAEHTLDPFNRQVVQSFPHQAHDVSYIRLNALRLAAEASAHPDPAAVAEASFGRFYEQRSLLCSDHLFPGAVDTLRSLKAKGYRVATISNGNADVALIPELRGLVDVHVSAAMAGAAKPHPRPFELLLAKLDLAPAQVLHVGDSHAADVLGARAAGMRTVFITPDLKSPHQADLALPAVADLDAWLGAKM
jgi:HAD superfamily hydrolase (TIGR01509 family)